MPVAALAPVVEPVEQEVAVDPLRRPPISGVWHEAQPTLANAALPVSASSGLGRVVRDDLLGPGQGVDERDEVAELLAVEVGRRRSG